MVVAHPMLIPAMGVQYCRAKRPPQLLPVAYRPIAGNLAGVGCGLRNAENAAVLDDGRIQMGEDPVERLAALGRKLTHEQRIGAVHVAPRPILHEFDLVDDVAVMFVGPVGVQVPDVVAEERVVRFGLHFHHGHRGASLGRGQGSALAAVRPSTLPACFSSARKSGRSSPSTCCSRRSAANAWARAYARHSSWTGVDWASSTISICAHSSATPPTTPSRPPPSCRWARHASHHGARAVLALSLHGAVSFRGPYPLKPAST